MLPSLIYWNCPSKLTDVERRHIAWAIVPVFPAYPDGSIKVDVDGRWMWQHAYGDRHHPFGWEIDHIIPRAMEGPDVAWNLRARHWLGNARAGQRIKGLLGV